jgi:hypothetical protein
MEYRLPDRYAPFVRGTLSVFGERDNTDVEIRDLANGAILHSFTINKGEEWSTSMMDAHININSTYNVTVLSGNSLNVTMGGAWMSYIPSHNGLKVGTNFTGFAPSEMFIFVPRNATMPPTSIEIIDLMTNDADSDDSKMITSASPELEFSIPDVVEIYNLGLDMNDFDDDVVHVNCNLRISVLAGKNSISHAWTVTPPSVDGSDIEVGTHFYTLASDSLTIFPTRDNTNVQIIDLTKNLDDDSITLTLDRNEFYTQRMNAYLGNLIQVSPWYTMFHKSNNIIDHDYVEVIADKDIIVYVGPIADDTFEFADLSPSVPTGSFSQEVYTYAQNGGADDLQLFVYDKDNTVINITSMTASRGALNFYDFTLDSDDFLGVGPYWWEWGGWNGNLLHIQSNLPINVFNGDFDGASFGTYLATVEPPPEFKFPDLTISPLDITFTPPGPVNNNTIITINATVWNVGEIETTDVNVSFYDGLPSPSTFIDSRIIPSLQILDSDYVEVQWTAAPPGWHTIYVVVDPNGMIGELDETNNNASRQIEVLPVLFDYVPRNVTPPSQKIGVGQTVQIDADVKNQGSNNPGIDSSIAFYNVTQPPFAYENMPGLNPGEVYNVSPVTWIAPSIPDIYYVNAEVDFNDTIPETNESNNIYNMTFDVRAPPTTSIVIGAPHYGSTPIYITSSTPINFNVVDNSDEGAATFYKIGLTGSWVNYTTTGEFTIPTEGEVAIYYFSRDYLGSNESEQIRIVRVDNTPPTTQFSVGEPKYRGDPASNWSVTSSTPISISSLDGGTTPVGLDYFEYRINEAQWRDFTSEFILTGVDGPYTLEFRGVDLLGNLEPIKTAVIYLDNTPPTTGLSQSHDPMTIDCHILLEPSDEGSGVKTTMYTQDGDTWVTSPLEIAIQEYGVFTIYYRSIDNLGNEEPLKTYTIEIPQPSDEYNWKPIVALVFALILAFAGFYIVKKKPVWPGRKTFYNWQRTALIFVILEAITGIVSLFTGLLSIPPLLGAGTIVDVTILIIGLLFPFILRKYFGVDKTVTAAIPQAATPVIYKFGEKKEEETDSTESKGESSSSEESAVKEDQETTNEGGEESDKGETAPTSEETKLEDPSESKMTIDEIK